MSGLTTKNVLVLLSVRNHLREGIDKWSLGLCSFMALIYLRTPDISFNFQLDPFGIETMSE